MHETGTGQQVAQLHERLIMMMMNFSQCKAVFFAIQNGIIRIDVIERI